MTTKQMEFCVVYQKGFKMVICFCGDTSNSKRLTSAVTGKVGYITDNEKMKEVLMREFIKGELYFTYGDWDEFNKKYDFSKKAIIN